MPFLVAFAVVSSAIALHELAHAVAARAVGHELFAVHIGTGPSIGFSVGRVPVRIGVLPLGGHVQAGTRRADGFRRRSIVVASAGAAANLVLAGIGVVLAIPALVVFNLLAVAANLWPGRRAGLGRPSSDGRVIWDLARGGPERLAEERSGWYVLRALALHGSGDLEAAAAVVDECLADVGETRPLLAVGGLVAFSTRRFALAVDRYAPLIADETVDIRGRGGYAADAAWGALLSGDDRLVEHALTWARFAHEVGPRTERRTLILALAEIESGEPRSGVERAARYDSDVARAIAAWGAIRAGEPGSGERWAVARDGLAPDHPLRIRIEAVLDVAEDEPEKPLEKG